MNAPVARQRLGSLYNSNDYPDSLVGLFSIEFDFPSVEPPAYYNSLKAYRKSMKEFDTPYTPNNQLVRGLVVSLRMIRNEGIENLWARTSRLARATSAS